MKKLKKIAQWAWFILIALTIIVPIVGFIDFDIGRYKRKFPQATTFDYWMDRNK